MDDLSIRVALRQATLASFRSGSEPQPSPSLAAECARQPLPNRTRGAELLLAVRRVTEARMSAARTAVLRRRWTSRATSWDHHVFASANFALLRDRLLIDAAPSEHDRCVDLGAGTGFVTLAIAPKVSSVLAVDVAHEMLAILRRQATCTPLGNVSAVVADLATFDLAPHSVDLVVSNYALHHLTDRDKAELLNRINVWLRPGGRVVIADMMFGRGGSVRDREILRTNVRSMLRKGPGGVWRIAKNLGRFGLRLGSERPVPPEFWTAAMRDAGFVDIAKRCVVAEACIVTARVPTES
jgi:SAM-dependent methyltransferase